MNLLRIDASARANRSHTRSLTERFVQRWLQQRPNDLVTVRDVGQLPPRAVTEKWIGAAFVKPELREPWMNDVLAESDMLVDELIAADLIVAGVPMYNFGLPAQLKAYIDNIVRLGRTFGFDRTRPDNPYSQLLAGMGKRLIILSSRGDYGYDPGGRLAQINHVEGPLRDVFGFLGVTDSHSIAIEYDEFGDERLKASIVAAERAVDDLADRLVRGQSRDAA